MAYSVAQASDIEERASKTGRFAAPAGRNDFGKALSSILTQFTERAVQMRGGAIAWRDPDPAASTVGTSLVGPHLYDGTLGIAFFLAAYYSVTGDCNARELALQSIRPIRTKVSCLAADPARSSKLPMALGGFLGLGSLVYGFTRMAAWLREPTLLDSACAAVTLITGERIRQDNRLDVMSGCSGTLLALLAFHREQYVERWDRVRALDLAIRCGEHLLTSRQSDPRTPPAWPGAQNPPMTGFAHGAAGISYALASLFARTGRSEFINAAMEGFEFERRLYDPRARTWLDPRFNRPLQQVAWCHGAPGIALARLGFLAFDSDPEIKADLEEALFITQLQDDCEKDHLCCGNSGRIEILDYAARTLGRPDLAATALSLAARMLDRAQTSGFCFDPADRRKVRTSDAPFHPSLFLGLAGAGYTLLRLLHPSRFPSVLLLA